MLSKKLIFGLFLLAAYGLAVNVVSCTHEDEVLEDIVEAAYEYGDEIINTTIGYEFYKSHSSITWESLYLGSGALLTGRFNDFVMAIDFDEDNPENTTLSGSVVLSSVNTGEPGRDKGCLLGTFGTVVDGTEEATFTSTSVEKDGVGGYDVTGTFSFHGVTDEITGKLTYLGNNLIPEESGIFGAPFWLAGFAMEFDINANSVFGLNSGNINDRVHIMCNAQFKWYL